MSDAPQAPSDPALEARITDLEVRFAFLQQTLDDLDGIVRNVADEMVRVRKAVEELEGKVEAVGSPGSGAEALQYEKPPHY